MPGEQELKLKARLEGGEETAAGLDKISGAEERVADDTKKSAGATEEATTAQDKLNAAESDYIGILNSIHPALGQMVDAGLKASKVAGDMASANLSAVGIWQKLTAAIQANAAALKLIGAGGLVAVAIMAIVHATRKMKEEFEAATRAIEENARALTELKEAERDRQQAIEDIAERRPEGGLSADQARAAAQRAKDIQMMQPWLQAEAIDRAAALYGERTREEQARAAYLQQAGKLSIEPTMPAAELEARLNAALERHAEAITAAFARERQQERELGEAARQQQADRTIGGSYEAILEFARRAAAGTGLDADELARMAAAFREVQAEYGDLLTPDILRTELAKVIGREDEGILGGYFKRTEPISAQELAFVERIVQLIEIASRGGQQSAGAGDQAGAAMESAATRMEQAAAKMERAAEKQEEAGRRPQVTYHQEHGRFVVPDADAYRRRCVNGESERERRGVG